MRQRSIDFGSLVRRADPDFNRESRYPVVYKFGRNRQFRSTGPEGGVYDPKFHAEQGITGGDETDV